MIYIQQPIYTASHLKTSQTITQQYQRGASRYQYGSLSNTQYHHFVKYQLFLSTQKSQASVKLFMVSRKKIYHCSKGLVYVNENNQATFTFYFFPSLSLHFIVLMHIVFVLISLYKGTTY